jgi:D-alanyl-lipoteichoic acid acyltransferase DltB (MBOAT superfamily)
LIAAVFFTFQIYGDFAGYSNIAIGTAKLFGIRLMQNFRTPYFSRDIAEFWRRWHISLTTWFRDYIYIPLGGSRVSKWKVVRNTFIIFLVSGLWHGANWTFIAWGFYHACLFLPLILLGRNRKYTDTVAANRVLPTVKELGQMTLTFMLAVIGWVVFRADSISSVTIFFSEMFNTSLFSMPFLYVGTKKAAMFIVVMLSIEWFTRTKEHGLQYGFKVPTWVKPLISFALVIILLEFSAASKSFIYFQF